METAISCRKCSHVAGLINKVHMQKHLKGSVAMCVLLACMSYIAHQCHGHYPGGTTSLEDSGGYCVSLVGLRLVQQYVQGPFNFLSIYSAFMKITYRRTGFNCVV